MSPAPFRVAAAATALFALTLGLIFMRGSTGHGQGARVVMEAPPVQEQAEMAAAGMATSTSSSEGDEVVTRYYDSEKRLLREMRRPMRIERTDHAPVVRTVFHWVILVPAAIWLLPALCSGPKAVAYSYIGALMLTAVGVTAGQLGVLFFGLLAFSLAAGFSAMLYQQLAQARQMS